VARFDLRPGLAQEIASRVLVPAVNEVARDIQAAAQRAAPDAAAWVTVQDDRVRPSHRDADGQTIPGNLRFALRKANGGSGVDMARAPRDPNLPLANREACRCESVTLGRVIAERIHALPAAVEGSRVRAEVEAVYPRIAESEFPSEPDSGGGWFRGSAEEVGRRRV
jgi:hypothetical protein